MSKGRNTTVVGIRLHDEIVSRLKTLARKRRVTMTELLKPVIANFAFRGYVPGETYFVERPAGDKLLHSGKVSKEVGNSNSIDGDLDGIPDLEKEPDHWKEAKPKFKASPTTETRNKAKAKRKAKKRRR